MVKDVKYVMITGVSSGIGYGAMSSLIERGYHVYGSVRNQDDASRLKEEFGPSYSPVMMDVTDPQSVRDACDKIQNEIGHIGLTCLINNAGIAIGGPILYQEMEEIERHFQINVIGLLRVTKALLPLLGAREGHPIPPGRIINISSVAGQFAQPFVGAYVGSKHAVEGISHSLRRELSLYDIDVVIIGPGAVKTPIWDKGVQLDKYYNTPYGKFLERFAKAARKGGSKGLTIEYLGNQIADIVGKKRPRLRYTYVRNYFTQGFLPRVLPHRLVDRYVKKQLKK